ncbi:MAG: hypothetical protein ACTSSQ_09060 [Alphaproteobacteria bacterium]
MRLLVPTMFGVLVSISAIPALAQGATDLSACQTISEDGARLACYDGLAATAMDESVRADEGGWVLEEWPSRLNPAWTDYEAWTAALNPVPGTGGIPVYPVLTVRCEQGETRAYFNFGRIVPGKTVQVHYRLGAGEIQPGELIPTPDGRRLGLWSSQLSVNFVRALYHSERLRIQVPVAGGEPLTAAFELAGISKIAVPLKEACGWQ